MSIQSFLIQPTLGFVPLDAAATAVARPTPAAPAAFAAPWEAPASTGVRVAEALIFATACVYFVLGAGVFGLL